MNPYLPSLARLVEIKDETPSIKTFSFEFLEKKEFNFKPGQFILVSVFGIGEAPFEVFRKNGKLSFTVRKVGNVTSALFSLKVGSLIGIRGPFGNGFPLEEFKEKNVYLIAGGSGIPPIRALADELGKEREKYKKIYFLYGAKEPREIVYKEYLEKLDFEVKLIVDRADEQWKGKVGVVTDLLDEIEIEDGVAAICGPPIMMKFVVKKLSEKGMNLNNIWVSMERLMQCGIGFCGRCGLGKFYICKDGPVFRVSDLLNNWENPW